MAGVHQRPGLSCGSSPVSDAGSGQVEKRRSALASGGAAVVRASGLGQSTGICRVRGEPRQCGDRAHRLIPPSMAPTGERRPSMACLRPIPALPRLSPAGCPWLRRCRLREAEGNARRSKERPRREGRRCKGISSERYMDVPRPRVGAGRGTTRRTKSPCSGGPGPKRSFCPCSDGPGTEPKLPLLICRGGPMPPPRLGEEPLCGPAVVTDTAAYCCIARCCGPRQLLASANDQRCHSGATARGCPLGTRHRIEVAPWEGTDAPAARSTP